MAAGELLGPHRCDGVWGGQPSYYTKAVTTNTLCLVAARVDPDSRGMTRHQYVNRHGNSPCGKDSHCQAEVTEKVLPWEL